MNWTLSKVWNESIESRTDRAIIPRDRIWASELGKADIEVWLKMKGEVPTNPMNNRAKRKMEAGLVFEWIVKLILQRCGIYKESQSWLGHTIEGCCEVSGKLDHIAGGIPNYTAVGELPETFDRAVKAIMEYFKKEYPNGLEEKILEIKSVSSFAFDYIEAAGKPVYGHDLQLFHYVNKLKKNGLIVYICRDDLRMFEIPVSYEDTELAKKYEDKIRKLSDYHFKKIQPPIEPAIIFEEYKFSKNFNAEYSGYLTKLYGFATQQEFSDAYQPTVERWNRVLGRIRDGKDMTDKNKDVIDEITNAGFDIIQLTNTIKNVKNI